MVLIMKYLFAFIISLFVFLNGCATLTVTSPEGYNATYSRYIFGQDIGGLEMYKDGNGTVRIVLQSQKSDVTVISDIVKTLANVK